MMYDALHWNFRAVRVVEVGVGAFFICLLLLAIVWLLWLNYQTLDGFNEDLKQLRLLVSHIERRISGEPELPINGPTAAPLQKEDV